MEKPKRFWALRFLAPQSPRPCFAWSVFFFLMASIVLLIGELELWGNWICLFGVSLGYAIRALHKKGGIRCFFKELRMRHVFKKLGMLFLANTSGVLLGAVISIFRQEYPVDINDFIGAILLSPFTQNFSWFPPPSEVPGIFYLLQPIVLNGLLITFVVLYWKKEKFRYLALLFLLLLVSNLSCIYMCFAAMSV
jgi:hypothetical protein